MDYPTRYCMTCGAPIPVRHKDSLRNYNLRCYCSKSCGRRAEAIGIRKPAHLVQHEHTGRCECGEPARHVRYVKMFNAIGKEIVGALELCDACLCLADDATVEPPALSEDPCWGFTPERAEEGPYYRQATIRLAVHGKRLQ